MRRGGDQTPPPLGGGGSERPPLLGWPLTSTCRVGIQQHFLVWGFSYFSSHPKGGLFDFMMTSIFWLCIYMFNVVLIFFWGVCCCCECAPLFPFKLYKDLDRPPPKASPKRQEPPIRAGEFGIPSRSIQTHLKAEKSCGPLPIQRYPHVKESRVLFFSGFP